MSMKKSVFEEALEVSLEIFDKDRNFVGKLVPVGEWILQDPGKIELIRSWRQKNKRMFFTQADTTFDRMSWYLKDLSIAQEGRLFFLLYDADDRFVGHMGIADVADGVGELDNLMRGSVGGDPRLVYFAEITLLDWCFKNLGMTETYVRVLSYNWLASSLHEEVGYVQEEMINLRKSTKDGVVFHDMCSSSESNVKYTCIRMLLTKDSFYRINSQLASAPAGIDSP